MQGACAWFVLLHCMKVGSCVVALFAYAATRSSSIICMCTIHIAFIVIFANYVYINIFGTHLRHFGPGWAGGIFFYRILALLSPKAPNVPIPKHTTSIGTRINRARTPSGLYSWARGHMVEAQDTSIYQNRTV